MVGKKKQVESMCYFLRTTDCLLWCNKTISDLLSHDTVL